MSFLRGGREPKLPVPLLVEQADNIVCDYITDDGNEHSLNEFIPDIPPPFRSFGAATPQGLFFI